VSAPAIDVEGALGRAAAVHGLDASGARVLRHMRNAVCLLPAIPAVARVTTGSDSLARASRVHTITRWLVDKRGFSATEPLRDLEPVAIDSTTTVSFWVYYPQDNLTEPTSTPLGQLLHELHDVSMPPIELPTWTPLESLSATLARGPYTGALTEDEHNWLTRSIDQIRDKFSRMHWPLGHGLIHGDAWAGNLLWNTIDTPVRAVLGDWDNVSDGPREIDLIPTWHANIRYGRDQAWVDAFIEQYGYDLTVWPGFDALVRMRDLVQLSGPLRRALDAPKYLAAFRQRFDAIRAGDRTSVWVMH